MEYPMSQLDPADRDKEIKDLEPEAKREAFSFFAMIVNQWVPLSGDICMWYSFGFCTCRNAVLPEGQFIQYHSESALADLYQSLLGTVPDKSMERHFGDIYHQIMPKPRCSFTEFWKAYDRGSLPSLFRKYGLEREMKQVTPHFAEFISSRFMHPSVWTLMNHLAVLTEVEQDQEISPPIMADYGFMFCRSTRQKNALLKAYKKVLLVADPLDLHQACIRWATVELEDATQTRYSPRLVQSITKSKSSTICSAGYLLKCWPNIIHFSGTGNAIDGSPSVISSWFTRSGIACPQVTSSIHSPD
jgi:hypothetical protein